MSQRLVTVDNDGAVRTITLNRPDKRNAVDRPTADALRQAFVDFANDDDSSVAVLTGAGGHFCAGADLAAMGDAERRNAVDPDGAGPGPMGPTRMLLDKPVIAAVPGYAVAGGLELALWCDMRVIEDSTVFGVFCRRWGVPLIDGGTVRLPRIVGQARALDMILTGRAVAADEAMQIGLASRRVADGQSLAAACELAHTLANFPQACLRADRRSLYVQWDHELGAALQHEGAGGYPVVFAEAITGAARFADGAGRHGHFESADHARSQAPDD
ncbi:enoyl-CoA hydratase [Salinisphaera sp. S4-8]|uniref:crotonase/enoyl-CoA hydratase family protein n=1 Tax=Salinisphaera sp. S4-8 TaxID=633357 RepID=UPI00333EB772